MSTLQAQATQFPGRPIPSETVEDIIARVAATANPEDIALVARLTVKQAPWHSEAIEITPVAAALILRDHNSANRVMHLPRSQMWARVMGRGEWGVTKDTIGFDVNGQICDGQHRFLALLIHDSPVLFGVQFGEAVESRDTYDAGTPRSAADILQMHGATDVTVREAVVKTATRYQQKFKKESRVPPDRAQVVEQAELHAHRLATAIGLARTSLEKPPESGPSFQTCLNLSTAASVAFLMLQGGWQSAETGAFLSHLQVGVGEGENHPITIGATLLIRDKRKKVEDRLNVDQKIAIALQVNYLWRMNLRQPIRKPKDLMTYMRPADLPPDPMGDGIPLPASPLTQ